ncbi:hypothetical protein LJK87_37225 [Paenibacillus sp. P25]|nr:hypothetical protein LJK87_37225 [Paenibacillus sp. P25]
MARCIRSAGLRDISLPYGIPQRGGIVHYDWLSVFFIGILYAGCLGFALLTSTGIIGEVRHWVGQVESTVDIPRLQEPVGPGVKRIVVQTSGQQVKLEKSEEPVVHLFGTYRTRTVAGDTEKVPAKESLYTIHTIGDTMYLQIKEPPIDRGIRSYRTYANVTIVLPAGVKTELLGADNQPVA